MIIRNGKFKHIKSNVSIAVEYMLNYYVTLSLIFLCFFVCMDKCNVIIFCNCVQHFCFGHWPYSVYFYICTWPLAINFADMPINILSWVEFELNHATLSPESGNRFTKELSQMYTETSYAIKKKKKKNIFQNTRVYLKNKFCMIELRGWNSIQALNLCVSLSSL